MPSYQGKIPKITWQSIQTQPLEGFENYSNFPADSNYWGNTYTALAEGPGGAINSTYAEAFDISDTGTGSAFSPGAAYAGAHAMRLILGSHPASISGRNIFLQRIVPGYAPGQVVTIGAYMGVGFRTGAPPASTPFGMRVGGVLGDTTEIDGTWVYRTATGPADGSGNLTVEFGVFGLQGTDGFPLQRYIFFDQLSIAGLTIVGPTNELVFGYPLHKVVTWPQPSQGSKEIQMDSGLRDAWVEDFDQMIQAEILSIPATTSSTGFSATVAGYDDGWRNFMEYARDGGIFTFYSDKDDPASGKEAILVSPLDFPGRSPYRTRTFTLQMKTADGSRWVGY